MTSPKIAPKDHEDSTSQVLVIELGDKTINKIAKILREMQTVELSNDTISKLKKINKTKATKNNHCNHFYDVKQITPS